MSAPSMVDHRDQVAPRTAARSTSDADRVAQLRDDITKRLTYSLGKDPNVAQSHDWLTAGILAVRERIIDSWRRSIRQTYASGGKRVYYLSLEFLIGRSFAGALSSLGLTDDMREALAQLGVDLDAVVPIEPDAALGNGGLGRLAACYMESTATLGIPCLGYGIRYDHGLFKQQIVDGKQVEIPEDWLSFRNPWEFERRESAYQIGFGGGCTVDEASGRVHWSPGETVYAVAYDTPVIGWRGEGASTLRLWRAQAVHPLHLDAFNTGDHLGALAERNRAEAISNVLYPSDTSMAGQELRLRQEYLFTSASLQDLVRRHIRQFGDLALLPEKAAIQLNDTHPALAVAELMRLLVDEHGLDWDTAWSITNGSISYTNHTLLPEALETWPVSLIERLLPRHMQIIFMINARFLEAARQSAPEAGPDLASLSLIDEQHGRRVRMSHLAFVGSHAVNGVSELHTDLMRRTVFAPLHQQFPDRITNVTNGITPRRWLTAANPRLAALLSEAVGADVSDDVTQIERVLPFGDDAAFRDRFAGVRADNKERLARYIQQELGITVDTAMLFDAQIKRIHEYKRQLLNILETVALYNAIRAEPYREWTPRLKLFSGKAAATYHTAKLIINLINDVATVINNDVTTRDRLKVVFLPNYNVSLAELVIPAADVSEQISTAGLEASGTGNMKFALNGAVTIGTLDGANIEIRDRVGEDNIFIFGKTAGEVARELEEPRATSTIIADTPYLRDVLDAVAGGAYSPGDRERYAPLIRGLRIDDRFMVLNDFEAYRTTQLQLAESWADKPSWWRKSIANTARCSWFSSDRAVGEYAARIWKTPIPARDPGSSPAGAVSAAHRPPA